MSDAILRIDSLLCMKTEESGSDEVKIRRDGLEVWPSSGDGFPLSNGASAVVAKDFFFGGAADTVISLWDADQASTDDPLGSVTIPASEAGTGSHTKEIIGPDSHYKINYRVGKIQF
ncbi:hypothetical protein [Streptomyces sp. CA-251251]|uniref:hypothetical protein n=1 Tax=Streptomyces sp. CA-251251 TaxID=3240063 RepID=UPI003D8D10B1